MIWIQISLFLLWFASYTWAMMIICKPMSIHNIKQVESAIRRLTLNLGISVLFIVSAIL